MIRLLLCLVAFALPATSIAAVRVAIERGAGAKSVLYSGATESIADLEVDLKAKLNGKPGLAILPLSRLGPGRAQLRVSIADGPPVTDNHYPLLSAVGGGEYWIYGPTLLPGCWRATRDGFDRIGRAVATSCETQGFLAVRGVSGSRSNAGAVPSWLDKVVEQTAAAAVKRLSTEFQPLRHPPRFAIAVAPGASSVIVGHVAPNGTVLFEVSPSIAQQDQPELSRTIIKPLVRHEVTHLWNAGQAHPAEGLGAWGHEGVAEYLGLKLSEEAGDLSPDEARWVLEAGLKRCADLLLSTAAAGPTDSPQFNYDCGRSAAWLTDRQAQRSGRSIFDVWREVLARAERNRGRYGAADLAAGERQVGIAPIRSWATRLLAARSTTDLASLAQSVRAGGVDLTFASTDKDYRASVLSAVLKPICTSQAYGFFDDGRAVSLDLDSNCPPLPPGATIVRVEGHDLLADSRGAYLAAANACQSSGRLFVALARPGQMLTLTCPVAPPPPTARFAINTGSSTGGGAKQR